MGSKGDRHSGSRKKLKFPGFRACVAMLRKHDAMTQEDGYHWLLPRVDEFLDDLIAELDKAENAGIRDWIIELIGASGSPKALGVLKSELLRTDTPDWTFWAANELLQFSKRDVKDALEDIEIQELLTPDIHPEIRRIWEDFKKRAQEKINER